MMQRTAGHRSRRFHPAGFWAVLLMLFGTVAVTVGSTAPAAAAPGDVATVVTVYAGTGGLGQGTDPIYPYDVFCVRAEVTTTDGTPVTSGGTNTYYIGGPQFQTPQGLSGDGSTTYCLGTPNATSLSIRVVFSGTTGFLASSGTTDPVTIVQRPTVMDPIQIGTATPVYGQSVTFSSTVTSNLPSVFPGLPTVGAAAAVTLGVNGTPVDSVRPEDGTGATSFTRTDLPAGTNTITFDYPVNAVYAAASRSTSVTVLPATTFTSVNAAPNPTTYGSPVGYLARVVSPTATVDQGQVQFTLGGLPVGQPVPINADGTATLFGQFPAAGTRTLSATYLPSSNFFPSSATPIPLQIDPATPTITLVSNQIPAQFGTQVRFTVGVVSAAGTPTGDVRFSIDGQVGAPVTLVNGIATLNTSSLGVGSHTITALYAGSVNYTAVTSSPLTQTITRADTTASLSSDANPAVVGTPVTFTATVGTATGTPTGQVTFTVDGTTGAPVTLVNGRATLQTADLSVGTHRITVDYLGSGTLTPSTSPVLTQVVDKAPATIALVSGTNPAAFGAPVRLTATVSSGIGVPTGQVTFTIDGDTGAPVTLVNGVAVLDTSSLSVGSHNITATYLGSSTLEARTSSPLTQVVQRAATTLDLASDTNPAAFGAPVTFTATVGTAVGTPGGQVVFTVDGAAGDPVTIVNGKATIDTRTLGVGSHTITAVYLGNGNYLPSTSDPVTQVIEKAASTVGLVSGTNPAEFGAPVTITATVASADVTPSGQVTFTVDGDTGDPVDLVNGVAALDTSALSVGDHTITATYLGSSDHLTSTSGPLTQTIQQAVTTVDVVSDTTPAPFGAPVTFTATVDVAHGTPSGQVTFTVDGTDSDPVTLAGGVATLTTSSLSVGTHSIVVNYPGTGDYTPSTSAPLTQVIEKAATTVDLVSDIEPSAFGSTVTFTASVDSAGGIPDGSVVFTVDGLAGDPVTLVDGKAVLDTSTLTAGVHTVTAAYSGSDSYAVSSSAPLTQTVERATTAVDLVSEPNPAEFGAPVAFTATVTSGSTPISGGQVEFRVDDVLLQTVDVDQDGVARARLSTTAVDALRAAARNTRAVPAAQGAPAVGSYTITATYLGTPNIAGSTSAVLTQVVGKANTTTTLVADAASVEPGTAVSFAATVSSASGPAVGSVTFSVDGNFLDPVVLDSSGMATLVLDDLAIGDHDVVANFFQNNSYFESSASVRVRVAPSGGTSSAEPEPTTTAPSSTPTTTGPGSSTVAPTGTTTTGGTTPATTTDPTTTGTSTAAPITAPTASTPPGELPNTGVDLGVPMALALALLLAGAALVRSARRSRRQH